jgi:hypothetical protein
MVSGDRQSPGTQAVAVRASSLPPMPGVSLGRGLFAAGVFHTDDVITTYPGDVICTGVSKKRPSQTHMCTVVNNRHFTVDGITEPAIGRGGGSFANSITPALVAAGYKANAKYDSFDVGMSLILRALCPIADGEEILTDYGSKLAFEVAAGLRLNTRFSLYYYRLRFPLHSRALPALG